MKISVLGGGSWGLALSNVLSNNSHEVLVYDLNEKIVDKIVDGQIKKFLKESCLLDQEYVKDPDKTVNDLLHEAIVKLGENIQIGRFTRFSLGK